MIVPSTTRMMSLPLIATGLPLAGNPKASPVGGGHLPVDDYPAVGKLPVEQDSVLRVGESVAHRGAKVVKKLAPEYGIHVAAAFAPRQPVAAQDSARRGINPRTLLWPRGRR